MSTRNEQIQAQTWAFNATGNAWSRHIIGPNELRALFDRLDNAESDLQRAREIAADLYNTSRELSRAQEEDYMAACLAYVAEIEPAFDNDQVEARRK